MPKQQEIEQGKSKENRKCREEVEVVSTGMILSAVCRRSALFTKGRADRKIFDASHVGWAAMTASGEAPRVF
jgi:hypothetical protein